MSETIYIVTFKDDTITEPELWGFESMSAAEQYAGVRGGYEDIQSLTVLNEAEAKREIDAEAKQRRDEEKFDRMRDEGEI